MKLLFIYCRYLVVCFFALFFISFQYDFHVYAERMIVKTREMYTFTFLNIIGRSPTNNHVDFCFIPSLV